MPVITISGWPSATRDRKSTRLNSSHTVIYTLSLHDALPICHLAHQLAKFESALGVAVVADADARHHHLRLAVRDARSEEHTSELQSHSDLHSFPTRRSSDLPPRTSARQVRVRARGRGSRRR